MSCCSHCKCNYYFTLNLFIFKNINAIIKFYNKVEFV